MTDHDSGVNPRRHPDLPEIQHMEPPHYGRGPTTHSKYGAGNPRLVMIGVEDAAERTTYLLDREETTIGSGADCHIVLDGLLPHHATITHTDTDEYVLDSMGQTHTESPGEESPYDDAPKGSLLRHGSGFTIGDHSFAFQRSEYADHGRPFGGRSGGEGSRQSRQDPPPDYRPAHTDAIDQERIAKAMAERQRKHGA
ncbi:FHA domain-containing protein [Gulosibacter molinativorax]|uniref:FHA domain-containing protein n=1 Tax=Gulosibacter molinativorax TaxID=256821 RepID=A0ABT7CAU1_9MICO|nr:FHA domain-containing protein [Gulosibacter molinativorax]MDJ1372240.1 hypothetical protein [Gulosibacter molinativorax]QUY63477.1 Hypotetical protein [Gulosibacter molinativorax]